MSRFTRARHELEAYVLANAPPHHRVPDASAYSRFEEWTRDASPGDSMPVYSGHCERTVYLTAAGNMAFRALHDTFHLRLEAGFTLADEVRVAQAQYRAAKRAGLSRDAARLLFLDIAAQAHYYARRKRFLTDQRRAMRRVWRFVTNSRRRGG